MDNPKNTELKIREDRPTGISSQAHGANADALGFNITFIAAYNPNLAVQIMKLYNEARTISPGDPQHPDEDFDLAFNKLPLND